MAMPTSISYSSSSKVTGVINSSRMLLCLWAVTITIFHASFVSSSDLAQDKAECMDKLLGLAACLPYVDGSSSAAAPTPDCCSGLKSVVSKSSRCLCVLIKDRNDPGLGLNVNVTRALLLPTACHAAVNLADCPKLLGLPAGSKDGQVFLQFAKDLGNCPTGASSSSSSSSGQGDTGGGGSGSVSSSSGSCGAGKKKWLPLLLAVAWVVLD